MQIMPGPPSLSLHAAPPSESVHTQVQVQNYVTAMAQSAPLAHHFSAGLDANMNRVSSPAVPVHGMVSMSNFAPMHGSGIQQAIVKQDGDTLSYL
jgi:hypothetical protein